MRKLRRIFFFTFLTVSTVVVAVSVAAYLYRDRIIQEFIREANKQLNTPVKVGRIDVSALESFPLISIVCHDVSVEDSHPGLYPLFTAREVRFRMNPIDVWRGNYTIRGVKIFDSETHLKIDAQGKNNFTIVNKSSQGGGGGVTFELRNVVLHSTRVRYVDLRLKHNMTFTSRSLRASVKTDNDIYTIAADGDVTTDELDIRGQSFLRGKPFEVRADLVYDDLNKALRINPSELKLRDARFVVRGDYVWKDKSVINLHAEGKNTNIQTLLSLLPEEVARRFDRYESRGDVYFSSTLQGEITDNVYPALSVDFGFSHATLFHPDYQSRIEDASVRGSFATTNLLRASKGTLVLKDVEGTLNDKAFAANLVMNDIDDPDIIFHFRGTLDAPALMSFYPIPALNDISGSMDIDLAFEGKVSLLKDKHTAQRVMTRGNVALQNISLTYGSRRVPLNNLNGSLQFSNNDLALSNVSGSLGNSDFLLNGFFKNVVTFIFFEGQPVGIEADLVSRLIDLDQIFIYTFGADSPDDAGVYAFNISPNVNLNFNCQVEALRYKRFRARKLRGDLLVKGQMAVSRSLALQTMGGSLELSSIVDGQNPDAIDVVTTARMKNLHIDSVFYTFENFNQTFIEDKHLRGRGSADVSLELVLNKSLKLYPETLTADIGITIRDGELNNFEPMQKLSRYLDDDGLSRLRFAELKNDIHIEKKTIYIPQMHVRSNVTSLEISGTHTFDQRIDYRVIAPIRRKKTDNPEALLATDDDPNTGPRLFLKITGTTDDYRVQYDTEAVKKKIVSDLKAEVQELKDAFKSKGKQKEKELELSKDDYFDWD